MQLRISTLALERAEERGADEVEIKDTLENGDEVTIKGNRIAREKVFPYLKDRNGKHYDQKKVRVIYVMEQDVFVVITIYVFYGYFKPL